MWVFTYPQLDTGIFLGWEGFQHTSPHWSIKCWQAAHTFDLKKYGELSDMQVAPQSFDLPRDRSQEQLTIKNHFFSLTD